MVKAKKKAPVIETTMFTARLGDNHSLRSTSIGGELFISSKDFLKYLLHLESTQHHLKSKSFVLNRLQQDFCLTTTDFWNDPENEKFVEPILSNLKENFSEHSVGGVIRAALFSNISDDLKIRVLNSQSSLNSFTHEQALKSESLSPKVKATLLSFKTNHNILEGIVLNEKDDYLLRTAMANIDIDLVTSPNVIDILILEPSLDKSKRIKLISRSSNLELLNQLIFNDDSMEIVKEARKRLKEMTPAEKFIMAA